MKIKNLSCTQFAGVRNRSVDFADGINVVWGKNESGKSTMANLLARTLFQKAKLDKRTDKAFCELYLPTAERGSLMGGDFSDGRLVFEGPDGEYILSKEWGADARCTLSTPQGVLRDQNRIDEVLRDVLVYGEGVYADLLLSNQRNTDTALQTLLDASKKTAAKAEITDVVSQAFAESDGISLEAIEQEIGAKIAEIAGEHWDMDRNAPVRRREGRWAKGLGEILKAYYALEDANAELAKITDLEGEADRTAEEYRKWDKAANLAEEKYSEFNQFAGSLEKRKERQNTIEHLEKDVAKMQNAQKDWPKQEAARQKAVALGTEKANREILDKYAQTAKLNDKLAELKPLAKDTPCPTAEEQANFQKAQQGLTRFENSLCGMNVTAAINMVGGHNVEVTSVLTGEKLAPQDGVLTLSEAVKICVPGVMEMQLSPANVDVAHINGRIAAGRKYLADVLAKFNVASAEELAELVRNVGEARVKYDSLNSQLTLLLGNIEFADLQAKAENISVTVREAAEIEGEIAALCPGVDVARFAAIKETVVGSYATEYGDMAALQRKLDDTQAELGKLQAADDEMQNIPAEFAAIADPKRHLQGLQGDWDVKRKMREQALTAKAAAAGKLESHRDNQAGDPEADAASAARYFEEQKTLLAHWQHIREVFAGQKAGISNNPMQDIATSFAGYLGIISDGGVVSEFPDADKLAMQVYSKERPLDYAKLSEGTKETVSLAFRLAVLDHLFPDGGGVMVLDDPLTDMDAERAAKSCELLREAAKRHQILFLTCREEYADMLGGNKIAL